MIADALHAEVERYAARMTTDNAVFVAAARGVFTPELAAQYIFNVRHLIRHSPDHLTRARNRASQLGDQHLAHHYACKLAEEQGHDRWADEDLDRMRARFLIADGLKVVPALLGLLRFIETTIDRDPKLYLAYILFAEQLVALRGSEWLALIESRCGIPSDMMSVIGKHAELDQGHAAEGLEAIDQLVTDPALLGPMRRTIVTSITLFDRFCSEIVGNRLEEPARWPVSSIG